MIRLGTQLAIMRLMRLGVRFSVRAHYPDKATTMDRYNGRNACLEATADMRDTGNDMIRAALEPGEK